MLQTYDFFFKLKQLSTANLCQFSFKLTVTCNFPGLTALNSNPVTLVLSNLISVFINRKSESPRPKVKFFLGTSPP